MDENIKEKLVGYLELLDEIKQKQAMNELQFHCCRSFAKTEEWMRCDKKKISTVMHLLQKTRLPI